jgi:hypothetical protein
LDFFLNLLSRKRITTPASSAPARRFRTARRAFEKAISCKSSTKDSGEVGVRIAIGRPSRVTTIVPSEATLDKTAPGLELNSREAIICIGTSFAQQMPNSNQILCCTYFSPVQRAARLFPRFQNKWR